MEKTSIGIEQNIIDKFQAMWGLHPSPVMMIRANRQIVAVNEAGNKLGIPLGIKCFQLTGRDKICDGCLGNEALRDQKGKRVAAWQEKLNMFADTYWIPIQGQGELFVHFGNNITPYVNKELCG